MRGLEVRGFSEAEPFLGSRPRPTRRDSVKLREIQRISGTKVLEISKRFLRGLRGGPRPKRRDSVALRFVTRDSCLVACRKSGDYSFGIWDCGLRIDN
jgi:hypothetical protein